MRPLDMSLNHYGGKICKLRALMRKINRLIVLRIDAGRVPINGFGRAT